MRKKDLNSTRALVQSILEQNPQTRNSDSYLYLCVLNVIAERRNYDLSQLSVPQFLLNLSISPFPPFESVRRSRQKIQKEFPHLASCEAVSEYRAENEAEYRSFARC